MCVSRLPFTANRWTDERRIQVMVKEVIQAENEGLELSHRSRRISCKHAVKVPFKPFQWDNCTTKIRVYTICYAPTVPTLRNRRLRPSGIAGRHKKIAVLIVEFE